MNIEELKAEIEEVDIELAVAIRRLHYAECRVHERRYQLDALLKDLAEAEL